MLGIKKEHLDEAMTVRIPFRVKDAILAEVERTKRRPADVVRDALMRGLGLHTDANGRGQQREARHDGQRK